MKTAIIVNPTAGRGLASRRVDATVRAFRGCGVEPVVLWTRRRGDARTLAVAAAAEYDTVVALGGDGTVHETACGLHGSPGRASLGVVPSGSGNDFAKMLGLPSRLRDVVVSIVRSNPRPIDLGRVVARNADGSEVEGFFVNAFGVGFDSAVAVRASRSRKIRGTMGYLWVAVGTLSRWRPRVMTIDADTWSRVGETLLATLGNGVCSGGGFYLTPQAKLDDSMLDLCVVYGMSVPGILCLLPRSMWGGHVQSRNVAYVKTAMATISTDPPTPIHLDGEILTEAAVHIRVEVIPRAIDVRAPFGD